VEPVIDADGSVTFTLDGIDQVKKDALDAANFRRQVTTGRRTSGDTVSTANARTVLGLVCLLGAYAQLCTAAVAHMPLWTAILPLVVVPAVIGLGRIVDTIRGRPLRWELRARFTLRLTPDALTCAEGTTELARVPTADIAEIVGGKRLSVVTQDAKTLRLPCVVDEATHAAIAADLSSRLRELRARNVDYRGVRVVVRDDEESEGSEPERRVRRS